MSSTLRQAGVMDMTTVGESAAVPSDLRAGRSLTGTDVGLLCVRVVLGVVFLGHGLQKFGLFDSGGYPNSISAQQDMLTLFGYSSVRGSCVDDHSQRAVRRTLDPSRGSNAARRCNHRRHHGAVRAGAAVGRRAVWQCDVWRLRVLVGRDGNGGRSSPRRAGERVGRCGGRLEVVRVAMGRSRVSRGPCGRAVRARRVGCRRRWHSAAAIVLKCSHHSRSHAGERSECGTAADHCRSDWTMTRSVRRPDTRAGRRG